MKMKENVKWPSIILLIGLLALSIVLFYYNNFWGIFALMVSPVLFLCSITVNYKTRGDVINGINRLYEQFDSLNRERMNQLPVAYVIVDKNGTIVWNNEAFHKNFYGTRSYEIVGRKLETEINLTLEECLKSQDLDYSFGNVNYEIVTQQISDSRGDLYIINFFDVTLLKRQKEIYSRYEPIFCYIILDNYDEVVDSLDNLERATYLSQIDVLLSDWAKRKDAFIMHYENDRYLVIFEREKLQVILDANFRILDEIREVGGSGKFSLSIGVGVSDRPRTIKEADDLSHQALEIAQARGGDQAVVKVDDALNYYGGKHEAREKSNKVRARVKARALHDLIKNADNVLIMGHSNPDADCLGAGIGIIEAAMDQGKNAKYILSGLNYNVDGLSEFLRRKDYPNPFISPEEVDGFLRDNTLLVVVDTQSADYVDYPPALEAVDKVVVIDHHRRPENAVKKPLLEFNEVYASSACELVSELLSYFDSKTVLSPIGATALMSGMIMDTKMFVNRTGVRTFEAASFLKRKGADMTQAKNLLKDDFTTYTSKVKAVQSAERPFDGVILSMYQDKSEYAKIVASQAADEMLNIKGIDASFVVLESADGVSISGRSNGSFNVQLILEALGGGGHFAMAGAQLGQIPLERGRELLLGEIENYLAERNYNLEDNEDNIA